MADTLTIKGFDRAIRYLERAARGIENEFARALYEEAVIEMTESIQRTPVKTGALRGSHTLDGPHRGFGVFGGNDIEVVIRVGGVAAPYAVIVHEDLEAFHKVGQAKFLESTIHESARFFAARIAKRVQLNRIGGL
jgi:hypothetical protein